MEGTGRRRAWAVCAAVVVAAAVVSLLWTNTASTQIFLSGGGWRCYPAKQPKGSQKFVPPPPITLNGNLQLNSTAQVLKPVFYCDPVNHAAINSTNSTEQLALVCYSIKDISGMKFPGATVQVNSDLFGGALAVKKSKIFCAPAFLVSVGP
jgi:hypothetical protein